MRRTTHKLCSSMIVPTVCSRSTKLFMGGTLCAGPGAGNLTPWWWWRRGATGHNSIVICNQRIAIIEHYDSCLPPPCGLIIYGSGVH